MPPLDLSSRYGVPLAALGLVLTTGCSTRTLDGEDDGGTVGEPGDITGDWKAIRITYGYDGDEYSYELPAKDSHDGCVYTWGIYLNVEEDGTGELINRYALDCPGSDDDYAYDEPVLVTTAPIPDTDQIRMTVQGGEVVICDVGGKKMTCIDDEGLGEIVFKRD